MSNTTLSTKERYAQCYRLWRMYFSRNNEANQDYEARDKKLRHEWGEVAKHTNPNGLIGCAADESLLRKRNLADPHKFRMMLFENKRQGLRLRGTATYANWVMHRQACIPLTAKLPS